MTIGKMDFLSQNPAYSDDIATKGFDLSAAKSWIYPENYPVRDYQYNIVETALYNNTLVCLPTGLGKTFIAAVVMYNYWRWYPQGRIVFLAPTKPLVAQQIGACHNVMGIPISETIELTGSINQKQRQLEWSKKRVIFATPQVFQNDLLKNIVPFDLVKCVVVDEAHRALGKHAYCECIRVLSERNCFFRVLALSATPGNKMEKVHEVVQNLHISQIELRDETSHDIKPYTNERKVDIILVHLGKELSDFRERYLNIIDPHVKFLYNCKVICPPTSNITKGKIFYTLQEFNKNPNRQGNHGQIIKTLTMLLTMYHAYELMVRHGLRAFMKFYQNHSDKHWIKGCHELHNLLDDVQSYLGPFPDVHLLPDGEIPEIPTNILFGHEKFNKLKELLVEHFKKVSPDRQSTRAIVFVEYKEIVSEVYVLLLQLRPLIRPQMFVGQSGQKQSVQIKALQDFRNNHVNVLISTCIGEEGLDVGEVDLIICFDISQQSPTRLVQRMGRTGRKRDGHIIVLVTDGKEHDLLRTTMRKRDSMTNNILNTSNITSSFYKHNPRMIPEAITPECHKRMMYVQQKVVTEKPKSMRKKAADKKLQPTLQKHVVKGKDKIDSHENFREDIMQTSMSKFLTKGKKQEDKVKIVPEERTANSPIKLRTHESIRNTIKPSNVKLLSCDNDTIDFLTLCAIKKSEEKTSEEIVNRTGNLKYLSCVPLMGNEHLNFKVPDVEILDCLSSLDENVITEILAINKEENDNVEENDMDEMDNFMWCNPYEDNNAVFADYSTKSVNEVNNACVSKSNFEDLLDDFSDSNETTYQSDEKYKDQDPVCPAKYVKCSKPNEINENEETSDTDLMLKNMELEIFDDVFKDSLEVDQEDIDQEKLASTVIADADNTIFEDLFKDSDIESEPETVTTEKRENTEAQKLNCNEHDVVSTDSFNSSFPQDKLNRLELHDNNKKPASKINYTKSTKDAMSTASLSGSNKSPVVNAMEINNLVQEYFSRTQDTCCHDVQESFTEKSNNNQVEIMESDDDMFAMDFEPINLDFENEEKNVERCNEPSHNGSEIIVLTDSDNDETRDTNESKSEIKQNFLKDGQCNRVINKNIECLLDDIEWNSDFEAPSTPTTNTNIKCKSSTPMNSHVNSRNSMKSKLDDEEESNEWIPIKPPSSLRKDSIKKLSRFTKTLSRKPQLMSRFDDDDDDFREDFVINADVQKLCESESSFFTKKSISFKSEASSSADETAYSERNESRQLIEKDLSVFKAPNKYLGALKGSGKAIQESTLNRKDSIRSNEQAMASNKRRKFDAGKAPCKKKQRNRIRNEFLECEAEVSGEDSTDESSGLDDDLDSFVSYTQNVTDAVDMQAHYLQAVRSPLKRHGAFIIKEPKSPDHEIDIYSQVPSQEIGSYLEDSFCVVADDEPFEETGHNLGYSILEEAERALRKKRKRSNSTETKSSKKKKNVKMLNTSISSEDEMEKLRKEIQDESMILKGLCT